MQIHQLDGYVISTTNPDVSIVITAPDGKTKKLVMKPNIKYHLPVPTINKKQDEHKAVVPIDHNLV